MRRVWMLLAVCTALAAGAASASAHPERNTYFPDASKGAVPKYRKGGPAQVVCKPDSRSRINGIYKGRAARKLRRKRLRQLKECKHRHIQAAVDAAKNGDRILIMPGVYQEEPSRAVPVDQAECRGMFETPDDGDPPVPTFEHQAKCPSSHNLIAIIGDSLEDPDRECDRKCNIQMEGMGREPKDVMIVNDRLKKDVIRADRADGFFLRNVWVEQGAFNNVDVVETNGFRLRKLVAPYGQNYGVLTFASDHGLYEHIEAYKNGDAGVYPGSGPEGGCTRYGIELRFIDSHHNVQGSSGTAGNGTWTRNSRFHHNNIGLTNDSFASGHPGMPQDCSKWTANSIYSNNENYFTDDRDAYCRDTAFEKRDKEIVCPQFQVPVGTGMGLYGVNNNLIQDNAIFDNWRSGIRLFYVPAAARGETDPAKQFDTSHGNRFLGNQFGLAPDGKRAPNGIDIFWDEQGRGNCWLGNEAPGAGVTSDPASLPRCPQGSMFDLGNAAKLAQEASCATWDPRDNPDPPGCAWFTTPPRPSGR